MKKADFIYAFLDKILGDEPCSLTIDGQDAADLMYEQHPGWCEKNCGKISGAQCWKKYLETLYKLEEKRQKESGTG